jgi:FG-GAP repeat
LAEARPALIANDGADYDNFGQGLALEGDTALIGAPFHTIAGGAQTGAVYVFQRTGQTWAQQGAAFGPADPTARAFGVSVAMSGDTAIVGAYQSNGVYTFARSGSTWAEQGSAIVPADLTYGDNFGFSLSLSGDTALIGAFDHTVGSVVRQGAAYVYVRDGVGWKNEAEFTESSGATDDDFGDAVALSGDTALVGANDANGQEGAAYVYTRSGSTWAQQGAPLSAPNPTAPRRARLRRRAAGRHGARRRARSQRRRRGVSLHACRLRLDAARPGVHATGGLARQTVRPDSRALRKYDLGR